MRARCTVLMALCFAWSQSAAAQNAVANPDFTTDLSNWSIANPIGQTPGAVFSQDPDTGTGAPLGAADLQYARPTGAATGELSVWTDCMPVAANTLVDFGAQARLVSGAPNATINVVLFVWDNAICTFGLSFNQATPGATVAGTLDNAPADFTQWTGSITTGASAQSMQMFLVVIPGADDNPSRAVFDRVFVGPDGTTPVELMTFSVE